MINLNLFRGYLYYVPGGHPYQVEHLIPRSFAFAFLPSKRPISGVIRSFAYNSAGHSKDPSNSPYAPVPIPMTFKPALANGHDCASGGARISSAFPHEARGTNPRLKTGFVWADMEVDDDKSVGRRLGLGA